MNNPTHLRPVEEDMVSPGDCLRGSPQEAPSHTPGPWEYVPSTEHHGPYVTTGADMTYGDICDCYVMSKPSALSIRNGGSSKPIHHQHEAADANARLIAAAPALLEALERLIPTNVNLNHPGLADDVTLPCDVSLGELRAARAAIALARGQS